MRNLVTTGLIGLAVMQLAGCPTFLAETSLPGAHVETSHGDFVIQLDPVSAPVTVANFLQYVDEDFYDGTVFHRVVFDFVVQGGGLTPDLVEKEAGLPIVNESDNGLSNTRATVAMARTDDPDSATTQFFINLKDNPELDATPEQPGYTVFGRVVEGMETVDHIAALATEERDGLSDVPVEDVIIEHVEPTELFGGIELTPEGEAYLESQTYRTLTLARDLLVQLLSYGLTRPWL
jgi:cyclophilin family peptidyl-prolyl cis-trans isomerase